MGLDAPVQRQLQRAHLPYTFSERFDAIVTGPDGSCRCEFEVEIEVQLVDDVPDDYAEPAFQFGLYAVREEIWSTQEHCGG